MTKALRQEMDRTEHKNATVAKGKKRKCEVFLQTGMIYRRVLLHAFTVFLFFFILRCRTMLDLTETLDVTCEVVILTFLASAVWFVLDFVSFCLWMRTCMNRSIRLSSHTHFHFFFRTCCDSYQLFPLEALLSLFLWKCKSLDENLSSENMWWRLVSSFSQIKRFTFNVTTVPCKSHVSFIVFWVLGCMWVWFFFIKSDKHLISRSNEVALMKTEMLGWLYFFLCGGKIAKSFQNMRQLFREKQKDVK